VEPISSIMTVMIITIVTIIVMMMVVIIIMTAIITMVTVWCLGGGVAGEGRQLQRGEPGLPQGKGAAPAGRHARGERLAGAGRGRPKGGRRWGSGCCLMLKTTCPLRWRPVTRRAVLIHSLTAKCLSSLPRDLS
jgi:hypothetical protein